MQRCGIGWLRSKVFAFWSARVLWERASLVADAVKSCVKLALRVKLRRGRGAYTRYEAIDDRLLRSKAYISKSAQVNVHIWVLPSFSCSIADLSSRCGRCPRTPFAQMQMRRWEECAAFARCCLSRRRERGRHRMHSSSRALACHTIRCLPWTNKALPCRAATASKRSSDRSAPLCDWQRDRRDKMQRRTRQSW